MGSNPTARTIFSLKDIMIRVQTKQYIDLSDWDDLVKRTYNRPYSFQQQDGCKERGTFSITIPEECDDEYENDNIQEVINGREMGVSFSAWLQRDPSIAVGTKTYHRDIFWNRNFYPNVQMVANDLHAKGLIPAGKYVIDIKW